MNRFPADSVKGLPLARGMVIDDVPFLDAWLRDYLRKALRPWVTVLVDDARRLFTLLFLVGSDLPDDALGFHRRH